LLTLSDKFSRLLSKGQAANGNGKEKYFDGAHFCDGGGTYCCKTRSGPAHTKRGFAQQAYNNASYNTGNQA
jgi:hypothetical protein